MELNHRSSSEDDDCDDPCETLRYIHRFNYKSKGDIIFAVTEYHNSIQRQFVIVQNDKRRYYVKCASERCAFHLNYNFRNNAFSAPSSEALHTCSVFEHAQENKVVTVNYLVRHPGVHPWFENEARNATTASLKRHLNSIGITAVPYHTLLRTLTALQKKSFVSDAKQYKLLETYVQVLKNAKHEAVIEAEKGIIKRLFIMFREGKQSLDAFFDRGLQLDETVLKSKIGGILLAACVKDSNNKIRTVGIAIANGENDDNWIWFLDQLKRNLSQTPKFVMSDREKSLTRAVAMVFPNVHHACCVRRVLENFTVKFKNKRLKDSVWNLAKALTQTQLNHAMDKMRAYPASIEWLEAIELEKLTLLKSPVCRFGMVASNNVETFNRRVFLLQHLPTVELLVSLERMVVSDTAKLLEKAKRWPAHYKLTKHAEKWLDNESKNAVGYLIKKTSANDFLVQNSRKKEYLVSTLSCGSCSCNLPLLMQLPCSHLIAVAREEGLDIYQYCAKTWSKQLYAQSCEPFDVASPMPIIDHLVEAAIVSPMLRKGRGRPKKRKIESQGATQELNAPRRRQYKCSQCHVLGHNKRQCRPTI